MSLDNDLLSIRISLPDDIKIFVRQWMFGMDHFWAPPASGSSVFFKVSSQSQKAFSWIGSGATAPEYTSMTSAESASG